MHIIFRKAEKNDINFIWDIIKQSIERRRKDGSDQWQNGYPNLQTIENDVDNNFGYVLIVNNEIAVYGAIIFNNEPSYENIVGAWLTEGDFAVVHRIAISEKFAGKGLAKKMFDCIEGFVKSQNIHSVRVDTNFDNLAMLSILKGRNYIYCGEVYQSGGVRKAFEKLVY